MQCNMYKKILIISPHTDDGELGCGGTISRFVREGVEIFYVALSDCQNAIPEGFDKEVLKNECLAATTRLGILESNVEILSFENKNFNNYRREIFNTLESIKEKIVPDLTFVPCSFDTHQDHQVVNEESKRVFRREYSLLGYEEPWNNITMTTNYFVTLNKEDIETKVSSLHCYGSQSFQKKPYFSDEYIWGLAKTRGVQTSNLYAEAFEVIKQVI